MNVTRGVLVERPSRSMGAGSAGRRQSYAATIRCGGKREGEGGHRARRPSTWAWLLLLRMFPPPRRLHYYYYCYYTTTTTTTTTNHHHYHRINVTEQHNTLLSAAAAGVGQAMLAARNARTHTHHAYYTQAHQAAAGILTRINATLPLGALRGRPPSYKIGNRRRES